MPEKRMNVEPVGVPGLVFIPLPGVAFPKVEVIVPEIYGHDELKDFEDRVTTEVMMKCGQTACGARVALSSASSVPPYEDKRVIIGATIKCNNVDCPLGGGPGDSGDREPRQPAPESPGIAATIDESPSSI